MTRDNVDDIVLSLRRISVTSVMGLLALVFSLGAWSFRLEFKIYELDARIDARIVAHERLQNEQLVRYDTLISNAEKKNGDLNLEIRTMRDKIDRIYELLTKSHGVN